LLLSGVRSIQQGSELFQMLVYSYGAPVIPLDV
jgi:hypothetical protein